MQQHGVHIQVTHKTHELLLIPKFISLPPHHSNYKNYSGKFGTHFAPFSFIKHMYQHYIYSSIAFWLSLAALDLFVLCGKVLDLAHILCYLDLL